MSSYLKIWLQQLGRLSPYSKRAFVPRNKIVLGVILAVLSNLLFAVLYLYSGWLSPLTGTQVFFWRVVMMFVVIFGFIVATNQTVLIKSDLKAIMGIKNWLLFILPTPILLSQLWLFVWAPLNDEALAVAMGYFLFPLAMVLLGCVLFGERLVGLQKLAVALAVIGVGLEIFGAGSLSWATFWVCGTFPIYYVMRKRQGVRAMTGLLVDTAIFLPVGIGYILTNPPMWVIFEPVFFIKTLGIGVVSITAFLANLHAIRLLPVSLFGMLSYLEPLLLFVLAVTVLGEPLTIQMLINYGFIWAGVGCLLIYGLKKNT